GTSPTSATSPATSPCCRCRQNHPNSTRSKTSGNSCATTGSPIVYSGPTTTSLSTVATPGTNSSISLGPSCRSACATGPTGSDQRDLVLERELAAEHREDDFPVAIGRGLVMDVAVGESVAVFRTGVDFVA